MFYQKIVFLGIDLTRRRHRRSKSKSSGGGHKDCPEFTDDNMTIEILKPGK